MAEQHSGGGSSGPNISDLKALAGRTLSDREHYDRRIKDAENEISDLGRALTALEKTAALIEHRLHALEKQLERLMSLGYKILAGVTLAVILALLKIVGGKI